MVRLSLLLCLVVLEEGTGVCEKLNQDRGGAPRGVASGWRGVRLV